MNGAILLAGLLAAGGNATDEWASAPVIKPQGQVIELPKDEQRKSARNTRIEMIEVPKGPPLTAQKNPDGSISLEHKPQKASQDRGQEAPK